MHGRIIKILLEEGTPTGIRHAEVVNWTGQAVVCPRTRVSELGGWKEEVERPGVYFLVGKDEKTGRDAVYIGEAENVRTRLQDHVKNKEFWREAILFTSKDMNLTKGHVRFLESHLVARVDRAKRVRLANGNAPSESQLPRSDRHAMEEFLENIELLSGALGYRFLEHVEEAIIKPKTGGTGGDFTLVTSGVRATGAPSDDGFVVHKDSTAVAKTSPKCPPYILELREQLLGDGVLVEYGSLLRFTESFAFTSPSAAAATVAGNSRNGREGWKLDDGRSLKAVEEELAESEE